MPAKKKTPTVRRRTKVEIEAAKPKEPEALPKWGTSFASVSNEEMVVRTSPGIADIATAICKVQREVQLIERDASGFKYRYTSLASVRDVIEPALAKAKLAVVQFPCGSGDRMGVTTLLIHADSGEWMQLGFTLPVAIVSGASWTQSAGAAITYARRYALCAALGIASADDIDVDDLPS